MKAEISKKLQKQVRTILQQNLYAKLRNLEFIVEAVERYNERSVIRTVIRTVIRKIILVALRKTN